LPNTSVSVVIPTYNSSGTLKLTLQSVLWQDFKDFEIWVIGDGCTADSEKVVTGFHHDRLHWLNLRTNSGGPGVPRREGISRATGSYVAYIGHDDLWFPWHLTKLVDCMERTDSEFVYSLGAIIAPKRIIRTFSLPQEPWSPLETVSPINWLHRKELLPTKVSWPTDLKYGDDREFLRRLLGAEVKLAFSKQLSVLKFPAQSWQTYSLRKNFPQERYVQEMSADAVKLRNELLLEFAATESVAQTKLSGLYRTFIEQAAFALLQGYGFQRWPVNHFLYRRYRKRAGLISP